MSCPGLNHVSRGSSTRVGRVRSHSEVSMAPHDPISSPSVSKSCEGHSHHCSSPLHRARSRRRRATMPHRPTRRARASGRARRHKAILSVNRDCPESYGNGRSRSSRNFHCGRTDQNRSDLHEPVFVEGRSNLWGLTGRRPPPPGADAAPRSIGSSKPHFRCASDDPAGHSQPVIRYDDTAARLRGDAVTRACLGAEAMHRQA